MSSQQSNFKHSIKSSKNIHKKTIHNSPNIFRIKSEQNLKSLGDIYMDEEKIQSQLMKQIQAARKTVQNYQKNIRQNYELKKIKKDDFKYPQKHLDNLRYVEEVINQKDSQIKIINDEIKFLKTAPDKIRNDFTNHYKSLKDAQLFVLADEILIERQQLVNLQKQHAKKKAQFQKHERYMKGLQQKYLDTNRNSTVKCLSFEEFKQLKYKKQKQDLAKFIKKGVKKNHIKQSRTNQEIKQILQSQFPGNKISTSSNNNLKQFRNKKQIAEAALRTAKKKHNSQMAELQAKIDFLKDQYQQLDSKVIQKMRELEAADHRFGQKNSIDRGKKLRRN